MQAGKYHIETITLLAGLRLSFSSHILTCMARDGSATFFVRNLPGLSDDSSGQARPVLWRTFHPITNNSNASCCDCNMNVTSLCSTVTELVCMRMRAAQQSQNRAVSRSRMQEGPGLREVSPR